MSNQECTWDDLTDYEKDVSVLLVIDKYMETSPLFRDYKIPAKRVVNMVLNSGHSAWLVTEFFRNQHFEVVESRQWPVMFERRDIDVRVKVRLDRDGATQIWTAGMHGEPISSPVELPAGWLK